MATDTDIVNLALAYLGESATVASIDPPDGSTQAKYMARFYPMARDALQEAYPWNFCTRRTKPAKLESETTAYEYAYQIPNNALKVFSVNPPDATDDYVAEFNESALQSITPTEIAVQQASAEVPRNYAIESLESGQIVVYTDIKDAVIRYSARVTDSAKFSSTFVMALGRLLASLAAGPVIRGEPGRREAMAQYQMFQREIGISQVTDANQSQRKITHTPEHLRRR